MSGYDAVIVGAGVVGTSVAQALASEGRTVCVLDRWGTPAAGSSSASSTIVRFNYSTAAGVAIAWESAHRWRDWAGFLDLPSARPGVARLVETGALTINSPAQSAGTVLALLTELRVPYQHCRPDDLHLVVPGISAGRYYPPRRVDDPEFWAEPGGEVDGYWTPDAGFVDDASLAVSNLLVSATRRGAAFRPHARVVEILRSGGRATGVALAEGERISAPVVVNATGPGSRRLNRLAGVDEEFAVRTRPLRVEVHELPAPPGYNAGRPGPVVMDLDLGTYFRGTLQDRILVGGVEPPCDELEWLPDADTYDQHPTSAGYRAQAWRVARRLPEVGVPDTVRGIAGVYDVADDWTPIYDKTSLDGYYVAIGTSGNQFKNAPVIGSIIARIIAHGEAGHDHDDRPAGLPLPLTGATADLGEFSRLRRPHQQTSAGVMG